MSYADTESRLKHLYPTDLLSMALALLFGVFSLLNAGKVTTKVFGWTTDREVVTGVLFLLLIPVLPLLFRWTNALSNRIVQFFRLFYAQLLYLFFYQQAIVLSQLFYHGRSFDAIFAKADHTIFAFQPSVRFHQAFSGSALINELFFFGYFSFFLLMTVGWWLLYAKGDLSGAVAAFTTITLSFYILYVFYTFFPVEGPKYYFPSLHREWYGHLKGYVFTAIMRYLFNNVDLAGAAFPSSHVLISSLALLLNLRYNRRLGIAFIPITLVLFLSTVYLYAHYVVDGIAALLLVPLFWWSVPVLLRGLRGTFEFLDSRIAALYRLPALAVRSTSEQKEAIQ